MWNVAVSSLSLELGRYDVCPSAEVIIIVPGTSMVLEVIGVPAVSMRRIGRLMLPAAGAKAGREMETVSVKLALERTEPTDPITPIVCGGLFAVCVYRSAAGKSS